ncbi:flavin monoamine oxidase family protein [Saccharopolyspora hattusasensis]|uniref:flavin monoamine oxidase family protein n=1 Tax=Saccharopolyspora hattusasensis TaxID=1128679 RepID=UPI003D951EB4
MVQVVDQPAGAYDVAVLGGGFAGMAASRTLSRAGHSVLIVEARDRLAGRMWTVPDYWEGHQAELGGAFILDPESYPLTWKEVNDAGLPLAWGSPQPTDLIWITKGERRVGALPVPFDELPSLERLVLHVNGLAARIDPNRPIEEQDVAELDVPWPRLLESLKLEPHTIDLWREHVAGVSGDPWEVPSALPLLHSVARAGSLMAALFVSAPVQTPMARTLGPQLARGTVSLLEAMAGGSSADVLLETVVTSVRDSGDRVNVATSRGDINVRGVVCALPIGVLPSVTFEPSLSDDLRPLAEQGVTGRGAKVTAFVSHCPRPFLARGFTSADGFSHASTTWHEDDRAAVVAFTAGPGPLDVSDMAAVQRELREYSPGIVVESVATHDWHGDPFSRGTWSYLRPGQTTVRAAARQRRGRIVFAGSDFDRRQGLEGALWTAQLASEEMRAVLA